MIIFFYKIFCKKTLSLNLFILRVEALDKKKIYKRLVYKNLLHFKKFS